LSYLVAGILLTGFRAEILLTGCPVIAHLPLYVYFLQRVRQTKATKKSHPMGQPHFTSLRKQQGPMQKPEMFCRFITPTGFYGAGRDGFLRLPNNMGSRESPVIWRFTTGRSNTQDLHVGRSIPPDAGQGGILRNGPVDLI